MVASWAASLPQRQWPQILDSLVGPDYFHTLRIPLLRGRTFTDEDTATAPRVAIVNQAFAQHFWPGQNPIGKHIRTGDSKGDDYEVVGMVATGKYNSLSEGPRPFFYLCILQLRDLSPTLVARSSESSAGLLASIRQIARKVDPKVPVRDLETMTQDTSITLLLPSLGADFFGLAGLLGLALPLQIDALPRLVDRSLGRDRFIARLAGAFALLAALLAPLCVSAASEARNFENFVLRDSV